MWPEIKGVDVLILSAQGKLKIHIIPHPRGIYSVVCNELKVFVEHTDTEHLPCAGCRARV